jgi:hypothetical protein
MSTTQTQRQAAPTGPRQEQAGRALRWRHPFDSASGTVALGVLLTIVLVLALRLFNR